MSDFINTRDVLGEQATLDAMVSGTITELNDEGVTRIRNKALTGVTSLLSVNLPNLTEVGETGFSNCSSLASVTAPKLKTIGSLAFYGTAITAVYFEEVTTIKDNSFGSCKSLKRVELPNYSGSILTSTFSSCSELEVAILPKVTALYESAFSGCSKLHTLQVPMVGTLYKNCLYNCASLPEIVFSGVRTLLNGAMMGFPAKKVTFPGLIQATGQNQSLGFGPYEIDIDGTISSLPAYMFPGDYNLMSLILRKDTRVTIDATAIKDSIIVNGGGYIYVPADLLESYQEANSALANRIVSLEQYPMPIGTISDTWQEIAAAESDGTYLTKYHVGDTKALWIGNTLKLIMIAAMDTDELSDGTGNAKITWLSCGSLPTVMKFDQTARYVSWADCSVRSYLRGQVYNGFPAELRSMIKTVDKVSYDGSNSGDVVSEETVWIPSVRELVPTTPFSYSYEQSGCQYTGVFSDNNSRIMKNGPLNNTGSTAECWTRTRRGGDEFLAVKSSGSMSTSYTVNSNYVMFGFCT